MIAVTLAVLCFSLGSTLIKKAETYGPTLAVWRMLAGTIGWTAILWIRQRRFVTLAELRRALLPGMAFGLNLVAFFSGVTHTTIANAEFISASTPLLIVPAGALLYHEHLDKRALAFGLISLGGLGLVLFGGGTSGGATWGGNAVVILATVFWAVYLLSGRRLRQTMSVDVIMASVMPIATLTVAPIGIAGGRLGEVTWRTVVVIILLAVITGTFGHGLLVFAQRSVPIGTISIMQVGQPAIAVIWSLLFLGASVASIQILGMALVLLGLLMVVLVTQRRVAWAERTAGELASPAG
jgi:drug/metabolite transporter (DMT)-like permease